MVQTASLHRHACVRVGVWQCSPTGSVWNCLWGHALKIYPGINRKCRVSYPDPGFLSSATWPSLLKKHYNGLNQTKPNHVCIYDYNVLNTDITPGNFAISQ